jgi:signal transduction histidine kinase
MVQTVKPRVLSTETGTRPKGRQQTSEGSVSNIRTQEGGTDDTVQACRQVAELLGFRGIDTVSRSSAAVEDVLEGRVDGLIVFRVNDVADVEVADVQGAPPARAQEPAVGAAAVSMAPTQPVLRALDAVRDVLRSQESTIASALEVVRVALGARQLLYLQEGDERLDVIAAMPEPRRSAVPTEVRSELRGIAQHLPVDDGTIRQLATVLGVACPHATAAFCSDGDRLEVLIAGWGAPPPVSDVDLRIVARGVAIAHEVLATRDEAVQRRLYGERLRWAGEIHDGLTQALTGAFLELKTLRGRIDRDPREAAGSLDDVMRDVRRSLAQVRGLLFNLTDASDGRDVSGLADFVAGVAERWRLPVDVVIDGDVSAAPASVRSTASSVIREGIANAAKHAGAGTASVRLRADHDELSIEIEDDGKGFDPARAVDRPGHFGLRLLEERVADSGGTLAIRSEPGKGTTVTARLPMRAREGEYR